MALHFFGAEVKARVYLLPKRDVPRFKARPYLLPRAQARLLPKAGPPAATREVSKRFFQTA